jgi:hypothetical protein
LKSEIGLIAAETLKMVIFGEETSKIFEIGEKTAAEALKLIISGEETSNLTNLCSV